MSTNRHQRVLRGVAALLIVALLLPGGFSTAQAPEDGDFTRFEPALRDEFTSDMDAHSDAPRYTIDLTIALDEAAATITGSQQVRYTNRTPHTLNRIVFRLYPNLPSFGGQMTVSRIMVDGRAAPAQLDPTGTVLSIPLPPPLARGESTTLALDYEIRVVAEQTRLYNQFSYIDGVLSLPNAYPVLSVYEPRSGWWSVTDHSQGDAVYSETGFYEVTLTAPDDLTVITSGTEIASDEGANGAVTRTIVAPLMRDFAIFAGPRYVSHSAEVDGVTVTIFYDPARPNAETNANAGLRATVEAVRLFNSLFGPYPYAKLDVVQTPTTAGGIEYPGVFVVGYDAWDQISDRFLFVVVHETAHQWWYSLVGNDQTLDPWMDEALAQFAVALFIGALEGDGSYGAAMNSFLLQHDRFVSLGEGLDFPIGLPVSEYEGMSYFYTVYQKGPLFFGALVDTYGGEAALGALSDYFDAYRYRIAEPADMLHSFEQSLDADLDDFFEEWVGEFAVG